MKFVRITRSILCVYYVTFLRRFRYDSRFYFGGVGGGGGGARGKKGSGTKLRGMSAAHGAVSR